MFMSDPSILPSTAFTPIHHSSSASLNSRDHFGGGGGGVGLWECGRERRLLKSPYIDGVSKDD